MSKISLFVYALLAVVTFAHISWAKPASDGYSSKYDSFDVQGVLASKRLVKKYGDCLMERGPCPPEGRFLKDVIPDAIATKCSKCNEKQKKLAGMMLQHLLLYYRDLFNELTSKYDPSGEVKKMYGIDVDGDNKDYDNYDEA